MCFNDKFQKFLKSLVEFYRYYILAMENKVKSPPHHYTFSKTTVASPRSSILQNITNMSSTFQRSTISTSKSKNESRLGSAEKSKIKSLPNYERYSMGNNLPFVTVFQTIEIERLSDEIETQRVKIKQYERLVFNSSNFQIQIKQLSQRCTMYEQQIGEYREQLDKMNKICQTLYHDNENLKNKLKNTDSNFKGKLEEESKKNKDLMEDVQRWCQKYHITEQMKQKQIEEIKSMMEQQRKSMLDREMKDLQAKHQSQVAKLSVEIRRLNELLDIKQRDLEETKKKHQNSQDYIKELKDYGSKLNEYEEKICLLSQQHLRLSRIVDLNTSQLDMARKKQFKLTQQLKSDKQLVFDNEHLREIVELKQRELETWKYKIMELQQEVMKGRQMLHVNAQLSAKIQCLTQENEKLVKLVRERSTQIEKWKKSLLDLEEDHRKCRQIEDLLIEQQSKCKVLQAQNEKIDAVFRIRSKQLDQLKNKFASAQNQLNQLSRVQKQKKNIEDKYKTQVERIMELELYIQKMEQQTTGIRQTDNKLKSTESVLESLKRDNDRMHQKINEYERELTILKQYQTQLANLYTKLREEENIIAEHENKALIMSEQISRLTEMLKIKNDEIVKLEDERISTFTLLSQAKGIQQQLEEKERIIVKVKSQVEVYQSKTTQYEHKIEQIQAKNKQLLTTLNSELQKLETQVKSKTKECDELKTREIKMQNQICEMGELQKLCQKQQNRITVYLRDLQDLRMQNKEYETLLSQQKKKLQAFQRQSQKMKMSAEQTYVKMLESGKQSQSNRSITSNNNMIEPQKLLSKISNLQTILNELKIKYAELLKAVNGSSTSIHSQRSTQRTSINEVQ